MEVLVAASIAIKLIASVLEIGSQSLISQFGGVELFGEYSFFVALVDMFFWLFFAGIMKLNSKFIPAKIDVSRFKSAVFLKYVAAISVTWIVVSILFDQPVGVLAGLVGLFELYAMDASSVFLSHGKYYPSLVGEYLIGRSVLLVAVIGLGLSGYLGYWSLMGAYAAQYAAVAIYFTVVRKLQYQTLFDRHRESSRQPRNLKGVLSKYAVFQTTEVGHSVIMESSVIVQYLFSGGYDTALISIVLIVRKVINFVTGPTSKLYQPDFSRVFSTGDRGALKSVYSKITGMQLCIMVPVTVFLVAQSGLVLSLFNKDLVEYSFLIQSTAVVFLFMVVFGPLSNFLSMVGKEKQDSLSNWLSIVGMFAVMFAFRESRYFVIFGFCFQIIFSTVYKLVVLVRYLQGAPLPVRTYLAVAGLGAVAVLAVDMLGGGVFATLVVCMALFLAIVRLVYTKKELSELAGKIKMKISKQR